MSSIVQTTGITVCKTATPTISTTPAYTSGDQIGGIIELTNVFREFYRAFEPRPQGDGGQTKWAGKATLKSISVVDISAQSANFDFYFFNQLPTVASSDNAALNIADAQILKCQHVYSFAPTAYSATSANSVASVGAIDLVIGQDSSALLDSVWVVAQIKSTATYTTTTALQFKFDFYID